MPANDVLLVQEDTLEVADRAATPTYIPQMMRGDWTNLDSTDEHCR